mmetsp:Transcript_3034/g.6429  ORF Transcript_3034/g.6429 Transcript_3034/m.6429 type:complete len:126 (-) Transcript_3034:129-506(-)
MTSTLEQGKQYGWKILAAIWYGLLSRRRTQISCPPRFQNRTLWLPSKFSSRINNTVAKNPLVGLIFNGRQDWLADSIPIQIVQLGRWAALHGQHLNNWRFVTALHTDDKVARWGAITFHAGLVAN